MSLLLEGRSREIERPDDFLRRNTEKRRRRVLVVGLDGGTFDLIDPWAREGRLPTLARLMDRGVRARLMSTIPPTTPIAWTTFSTGKNPGKHGVLGFTKRSAGSYEESVASAADIDGETLWTILSRTGKKVVVLNVPMTYPVSPVNGIMISGFMTPFNAPYSYASDVDLTDMLKGYRIYMQKNLADSDRAIDEWLADLYDVTRRRAKLALHLLKNYDWDFFMVVFSGTDWICHAFWRYMDPTCTGYDESKAETHGDVIKEYYSEIDSILEKFLAAIEEDTALMIMSDHGSAPVRKILYLNDWLQRAGFLKLKEGTLADPRRVDVWLPRLGLPLEKVLSFLASHGTLMKVARSVWRRMGTEITISGRTDWSKTTAYISGEGIRINLKGREPNGIVEPGEEFEEVIRSLSEKLIDYRDERTGEKLVEKVLRREEVYFGPHAEDAPDLFVRTAYSVLPYRGFELRREVIRPAANVLFGPLQYGKHDMEGVFLATGKDIRRGETIAGASLEDLTPTILHSLGLPVPDDMDGKVLPIFEPDSELAQKTPSRVPAQAPGERKEMPYSKTEEEDLLRRLKGLGYLG